jgi:hypothetical protein
VPALASARSNGFPGVFGVLAEPKEAIAPDPRPNALEAPPPGDARLAPGVVAGLKGFAFPCDELSPPNRLEKEALRVALSPGPLGPGVARESLLELRCRRMLVIELSHTRSLERPFECLGNTKRG